MRELVKLSKQVKSVDLLQVPHDNDATTSLVEVPRSSKQSGFKQRARKSMWAQRILKSVRRHKNEDLLVDEHDDDAENDETAHTDDDAARWLITCLGDCCPSEFVKSAQGLDMPIHKGKVDAGHACAMWSDAGVGVAAQRITMKCFISFFGCKFTVPEASINKLAADSVPPIVGTMEHMDHMLDCWCKDLVGLLTVKIGSEHSNQPGGFSHASVDFVIGADHGQGSFRAGVKAICRKADGSIAATAVYGLGEIECAKDTGDLLALALLPKLNTALKRIISCQRDENGKLVSDGTLAVHQRAEVDAGQKAEGKLSFHAILDRTGQQDVNDSVFVTGDLAFHATAAGKEGMDKAHCIWCKLKGSEWQCHGHDRGAKWTLQELKRVASSHNNGKTENGVKSHPQLDCVELEQFIFPVSHVTLGLANRLLKHAIDHADKLVERTPQLLKDVRINQIAAERKHEASKQETVYWGLHNGPTLANMHLAQGHLDEEIAVEGVLNEEERMTAIENAASLKEEITSFKKELTDLKKKKTGLSQANTAAKAEVLVVEKEVGHCSKPIRKGLESILAKEWNIKRPSWHRGDVLGNERRKLMAWARLVCNQMKAFLLEKTVEDGASERAKKEVTKRCDIVAKCLLLFDGFLSVLRTDHKDLTPELIEKARECATKALAVWRMLNLSVTPKCHGSECHAAGPSGLL